MYFKFCSMKASILSLCIPVGSFLVGQIMDRMGRKKTCFLCTFPLLASWIIVSASSTDNVYMFIAFRIFAGIGAGKTFKNYELKFAVIHLIFIWRIFRNVCCQFGICVGNKSFVLQTDIVVFKQCIFLMWRANFHFYIEP